VDKELYNDNNNAARGIYHPEGCQLPAIYIEIGFNTVYYITLKFRNTIYEIKWKILSIPKSIQEVSND
jgi:hypothetical protein